MKKEIRIPKFLGIFVLLLGTVAAVYLINRSSENRGQAASDCQPVNPQVTNITHQSFDISFITKSSCTATVSVNGMVVDDMRKLTNPNFSGSQVHYFQVNNLHESTDYKFSIVSGGSVYSSDANRTKTASKPSATIPTSNLAWGRVLLPNKQPAANAIVYLNIPGAAPLSSLVTTSGNWNVSLAYSFNSDKTNWFTPPQKTDEDIVVLSDNNKTTEVTANTSQNNPVPDIIIGQNFLSQTSTAFGSQTGTFNNSSSGSQASQKSLSITYPADLEKIPVNRPEFMGNGPGGSLISLTVQPGQVSGSANIDNSGSWRWTPNQDLLVGSYTLTVKVSGNSSAAVSRSFSIVSGSNNLAFTASNSAQLSSPTPILTSTPVPTAVPQLTTVPTVTKAVTVPTATPALIPTISGMPATGNELPTFSIIGASIVMVVLSLGLIL